MSAIHRWKRIAAAVALRVSGHPARVRRRLYGKRTGLRILTFHRLPENEVSRFREFVDWCCRHFEVVGPDEADRFCEGRFEPGERDKLLITFDDGHQEDFAQAAWLAARGIRAVYFVIPSYIDRSVERFMAYHAERGVTAFDIAQERPHGSAHALSREQLAGMIDMGHRIGAHNFAHRDLASLRDEADLRYEIEQALESVAEWTGEPCHDFAWAFGNVEHLSPEAAAFLGARCRRVFSSVRGLNVDFAAGGPLLRDAIHPADPLVLARFFAEGGADDRWRAQVDAMRELYGRGSANRATR